MAAQRRSAGALCAPSIPPLPQAPARSAQCHKPLWSIQLRHEARRVLGASCLRLPAAVLHPQEVQKPGLAAGRRWQPCWARLLAAASARRRAATAAAALAVIVLLVDLPAGSAVQPRPRHPWHRGHSLRLPRCARPSPPAYPRCFPAPLPLRRITQNNLLAWLRPLQVHAAVGPTSPSSRGTARRRLCCATSRRHSARPTCCGRCWAQRCADMHCPCKPGGWLVHTA